jgi:hypothetical protein
MEGLWLHRQWDHGLLLAGKLSQIYVILDTMQMCTNLHINGNTRSVP